MDQLDKVRAEFQNFVKCSGSSGQLKVGQVTSYMTKQRQKRCRSYMVDIELAKLGKLANALQ